MIRVIDDYVVERGPYDYMLARDTGKVKKGCRVLKPISYHASLRKAILALREYCVGKSLSEKDMSLCEAIDAIRQCDKRFEDLLNQAIEEER